MQARIMNEVVLGLPGILRLAGVPDRIVIDFEQVMELQTETPLDPLVVLAHARSCTHNSERSDGELENGDS